MSDRKGRHYSRMEIESIREMAKTMTAKQVGEKLGRKEKSIQAVAHRCGISFGDKCQGSYTHKQVSQVLALWHKGETFRDISNMTGVNFHSCKYMCRTRGGKRYED